MRTDTALRKALLARRGFTKQRLSQLVKKRKQQLPMSTPMAVYTIAHESGIDVSKYLAANETSEIRGLVAQLGVTAVPPRQAPSKKDTRRPVHVTIAGLKVDQLPGLSPTHAREAKEMAEKVFPALYVFENSLRDIIERVLKSAVGSDWWDRVVPKPVRDRAVEHKAAEKKDPWHGKRGDRDLDYILLTDLLTIARSGKVWPHLMKLFPSQTWLDGIIADLNVSRRVIAHMNPLSADDIQAIEVAFKKWMKQLKAVEAELP